MKKILYGLIISAAYILLLALPVMGGQSTVAGGNDAGMQSRKDECLLMAKNCATESIQERIERITEEIKKGDSVYSPDELIRLENQLADYNNLFENMKTRGGNRL